MAASTTLLLFALSVLMQSAHAYDKNWYKDVEMKRSDALAQGYKTKYIKMVPMLACDGPECEGKDAPETVMLGDVFWNDKFGTFDIPRFFFD